VTAAPLPALPTLPLATPGLVLRAWQAADAPHLARHANDEAVWRNMSEDFPYSYTLAIAQHWVEHGYIDFGGGNWAIAVDGVAVGGCGIHAGTVIDRVLMARHRPGLVGGVPALPG
jgi:RimJ/RimL family protein N-acetyltransferase